MLFFLQPFLHIPFTQSKRQDRSHVPYYLLNFETIVRGVIDETDDVQLFDEEDLSVVRIFRNLDLVRKKIIIVNFMNLNYLYPEPTPFNVAI